MKPDRYVMGVPVHRVPTERVAAAERELGWLPLWALEVVDAYEMAPPCWRTYAMQVGWLLRCEWYGHARVVLRVAWSAGLIELPYLPTGAGYGIRIRPFPWRGREREYSTREAA